MGGRLAHDPADWTFETCADDVRAFCDRLGITRPIVYGHSMGGFVAMLYAARHPGHAGRLFLQSTHARFDLARLVEAVRGVAGDEVAELARRDYGGAPISDAEWAASTPRSDRMSRTSDNWTAASRTRRSRCAGWRCSRSSTSSTSWPPSSCPTLVCVGALDPITPVSAAREIVDALSPGVGRLELIEGAGHFPWLTRRTATGRSSRRSWSNCRDGTRKTGGFDGTDGRCCGGALSATWAARSLDPGRLHDPVDLPGRAVVGREGLLPAAGPVGDVRPQEPDEDRPALERVRRR